MENDPDIRALTASEAIAAATDVPTTGGIFPASWINANFDVWIGHREDVAAWELLWDARDAYARAAKAAADGLEGAPTATGLATAMESLLAAEGSDWTWWYGPEHSTDNDMEFDALFRKHLTAIYLALGEEAPDELAKPIKRQAEHALQIAPADLLNIKVDGRDTSYFEWLSSGLYSPERRGGAMHGRVFYLHELRFGFEKERFCLRVDPFPDAMAEVEEHEFRVTIWAAEEITVIVRVVRGRIVEFAIEQGRACLLNPKDFAEVAFDTILEVAIRKDKLDLAGVTKLKVGVALWHGGLPVDVLPSEALLEIPLGEDTAAWPLEPSQT